MGSILEVASLVHAVIVLDQVQIPETGVVTQAVLAVLDSIMRQNPELLVLADSRRGLRGYPPVVFKMNASELGSLMGSPGALDLAQTKEKAGELAHKNARSVFVTLAEQGIVGATATGEVEHVPALPLRGEIDIVGAGDGVSANLVAAISAGAFAAFA